MISGITEPLDRISTAGTPFSKTMRTLWITRGGPKFCAHTWRANTTINVLTQTDLDPNRGTIPRWKLEGNIPQGPRVREQEVGSYMSGVRSSSARLQHCGFRLLTPANGLLRSSD